MKDITQKKAAESEKELLLAAIEQSGEIIIITDPNGLISYVNPVFETVTGYSRNEALCQSPGILSSGTHDEDFFRNIWSRIAAGGTWSGNIINRHKNGGLFTVQATISPVQDSEGNIISYLAAMKDITQEVTLEEQHRQTQKMEALGQLTGGVAHDFNNLLQVIIGVSDFALENLEPKHPARPYIMEAVSAGEKAADLVEQLLLFSRRQIMREEIFPLNHLIANLLKMLERVLGENIRLQWIPGQQNDAVKADRGMIEQAIINLCVNARDAMSDSGVLTLETENVLINQEYCRTHSWARPGRYILLTVTDTGCGMDNRTLEHIFEPFFTTKDFGQGTGLGLATVYGIVKQHNGMVNAYSEPGKGTTFKIYLPVAERAASEVGSKLSPPALRGSETILIAEDNEMVLKLAVNILENAGYRVLASRDGAEALRMFEKRADSIDLALLDVVMPELGGRRVYEAMKDRKPSLPVLFVSGYSEYATDTSFILENSLPLLQKPYSREDLLRTIRAVLNPE